jgi:hypothetical protein
MSGLMGVVYWVPVEDIDWTTPPAFTKTTVTGNIPLKTDKKFYQLYFTSDTGKIDSNMVGERDGKSYENILEVKYPGDTEAVIDFLRQVKNTPVVAIVRDRQGKYRLVGVSINGTSLTIDNPAYVEGGTGTTGAAPADAKGHTIQFKAAANHAPLFYTGTIDITAPDA